MCLGVPGRIVSVSEEQGVRMGAVDFGGIERTVCLAYVPEADVGSWVVIHVGFAISVVDEEEARRAYELLAEMGALEDIDLPQAPEGVHAEDYRPTGSSGGGRR